MKIVTYLAVIVAATFALSSCKKDKGDDINPEYIKKADEFKAFIASKVFQIADYYSDKPIDYIEDDTEIRSETELWKYVSPWLKDDYNVFNNNTNKVEITQNDSKISTDNSAVIVKDFNIGADKDGPYFNFLSHEYQPLKYRLVEFTGDQFIVYVNWHSGAKVFTKFHAITP